MLARIDPLGLLDDLGAQASKASKDILQRDGDFYDALIAAPNVRPIHLENHAKMSASRSRTVSPGTTLQGVWGEAIVAKSLRRTNDRGAPLPWWLRPAVQTRVWHQPLSSGLDGVFPSGLSEVFGDTLPDLVALEIGGKFPVTAWTSVVREIEWRGVIGRETGGRVGKINWGARRVFSVMEVTTTNDFDKILTRMAKVAAWAQGSNKLGVKAVLVIDRGVYFDKLTDEQRAQLSGMATASGSYIRLENGLRAQAIEKADTTHRELREAN